MLVTVSAMYRGVEDVCVCVCGGGGGLGLFSDNSKFRIQVLIKTKAIKT